MLYPASGTGATEAALVNALAPGDRVLVFNYGVFSGGMAIIARKFGFEVDEVPLRWGQAVPPDEVERRLQGRQPDQPVSGGDDRPQRDVDRRHRATSPRFARRWTPPATTRC